MKLRQLIWFKKVSSQELGQVLGGTRFDRKHYLLVQPLLSFLSLTGGRRFLFPSRFKVQEGTVAQKYKRHMLADFTSTVIFLFSARNVAAPQDKS